MSSALMGELMTPAVNPEKSCQQSPRGDRPSPLPSRHCGGPLRAQREHAWGEARCVEDRLCAADEVRRGCGLE